VAAVQQSDFEPFEEILTVLARATVIRPPIP
jgi:hypothetical protein